MGAISMTRFPKELAESLFPDHLKEGEEFDDIVEAWDTGGSHELLLPHFEVVRLRVHGVHEGLQGQVRTGHSERREDASRRGDLLRDESGKTVRELPFLRRGGFRQAVFHT